MACHGLAFYDMLTEHRLRLGRCNAFAALGTALIPWKKQGVAQEDTIRALRATVRSAEQDPCLALCDAMYIHVCYVMLSHGRAACI
jgi:hypothetical protein